jgi:hypothetical protein
LTYAHTIDLFVVSTDFAHAVSRVGSDAVPEALFAIADRNDPLTIPIPCNIIDAPGDD